MSYNNKVNKSIFDNLWLTFPLLTVIILGRVIIPKIIENVQERNPDISYSIFSLENNCLISGLKVGLVVLIISFLFYLFCNNLIYKLACKKFPQDEIVFSYQLFIKLMYGVQFFIGSIAGYYLLPLWQNLYLNSFEAGYFMIFIIAGLYCALDFQYQTVILTNKCLCCVHPIGNFSDKNVIINDIKKCKYTKNELIVILKDDTVVCFALKKDAAGILEKELKELMENKGG